MSYDLFLRPRSTTVSPDAFFDYFRGRAHYKVESGQAWYQNEDTGVYFVFEQNDPEEDGDGLHHPFQFNINFFRPSYFILEAEPEVTALVKHFDFLVSDPQTDGMGEGEYVADLLIAGWRHGNEFGMSAVLGQKDRPDVVSLPAARLHEVWRWNLGREELQASVGEGQFVPLIMFLRLNGAAVTAAVWPDGIPIVLPKVDYVIVGRDELAPRTLLRKKKDSVFVEWAEASSLLGKYQSLKHGGALNLNYRERPQEIAAFVRGLVRSEPSVTGVAADSVLDRELVEKYAV